MKMVEHRWMVSHERFAIVQAVHTVAKRICVPTPTPLELRIHMGCGTYLKLHNAHCAS